MSVDGRAEPGRNGGWRSPGLSMLGGFLPLAALFGLYLMNGQGIVEPPRWLTDVLGWAVPIVEVGGLGLLLLIRRTRSVGLWFGAGFLLAIALSFVGVALIGVACGGLC